MSPPSWTSPLDRGRAPSLPPGLRVYAVGDVHGRLDLLQPLLDTIVADVALRPVPQPVLVMLGDYVDRGQSSAGVMELLASGLAGAPPAVLLKGNHEEMMERFLADGSGGALWRQSGGLETLLSYRVPVSSVLPRAGHEGLSTALAEAMPASHRDLLATLRPCWSAGDYFFCHAGVRPGVPLESQRIEDLMWIRGPFISSNADFGKVVVHGHTPVESPEIHHNRINIDTGAYITGRLTCLVLEADEQRLVTT
jgi:serine/threonine protein phosphatase 1